MTTSTNKSSALDDATVERMQAAVVRAGEFLQAEAGRIAAVAGTSRENENPHTNLDLEVDEMLALSLPDEFGFDALWLSEERPAPDDRFDARYVFIIDPIDGTRNVLHGRQEACISAALYERGQGVVWGCVYNPFSREMFSARPGQGAYLNGRQIHVSTTADMRSALFLVSIHESVKGMLDVVKADINVRPVGSIAYKMCLVAAGKGDATFTVNPRHDWDIAAATLIVTEAGGKVTDSLGKPTSVNSQTLVSDGVIVSNGLIHDGIVPVCAMVREQLALASPRPV